MSGKRAPRGPGEHSGQSLRVFGVHPVRALLETGRLSRISVRAGGKEARLAHVIETARAAGVPVSLLSADAFDAQLGRDDVTHQGVFADARPREMEPENALPVLLDGLSAPLVLVLDGVTDPHNFGACLRSAEAFGAACVIVPKDHSAPLNQIARKTSSGASELIPVVRVTNLARCLRGLQSDGFWVVGADGEATAGMAFGSPDQPLALVMGAEGTGLRRLTRETCDALVAIPMVGRIESLNVSVATGVLLYGLQSARGVLTDATRGERV